MQNQVDLPSPLRIPKRNLPGHVYRIVRWSRHYSGNVLVNTDSIRYGRRFSGFY